MKTKGAIAIRGAGRPSVGGRRTVGAARTDEDQVTLHTKRRAVRPLAAGAPKFDTLEPISAISGSQVFSNQGLASARRNFM